MKSLKDAMRARGWSVYETSNKTGITEQSIRNLLREGATRTTLPGNVTAFTLCRLLEAFPTLDLSDFVAGTNLSVRGGRGEA